jgi:hypothetical protein
MSQFHFYDSSTGQLHPNAIVINAPPEDQALTAQRNCPTGYKVLEGIVDPLSQYVDVASGTVLARGACPITSAVAARVVTLSGVPSGAPFTIAGNASLTGTADSSGTLTLTFGAAGTYAVSIACPPLLDYFGSFTLP